MLSIDTYARNDTMRTWGKAQAIRYIDELEQCCRDFADNPLAGRSCDDDLNLLRPGLYRIEIGRHVVFFRREPSGILVSRILHERMLPERHSFNDE